MLVGTILQNRRASILLITGLVRVQYSRPSYAGFRQGLDTRMVGFY